MILCGSKSTASKQPDVQKMKYLRNSHYGRSALVALAVATGALPAAAAYGPPFLTDDPQPVDFMHYEFYIATQYFHQFGSTTGTLPHFEINYGAAPNLQIHLIAPVAYSTGGGQPFNYGYGDTEVGAKYRFVQETKKQPMVGIFPLVELPTGNQTKGLGTGQTAFYLPVWIQKGFGSWTAYGGGGYWRNPGAGNRDYWFSGLTLQCQTTKQFMVGGELYHTTSQAVGMGENTGFNIGGVYDFDEGHHLMLSVGTGLRGSNRGTAYLAYQWTFGPKDKKEGSGK
jgi:hypothetical protein